MRGSEQTGMTAELLGVLFNGRGKIRTIKKKQFFDYFVSMMNRFQGSGVRLSVQSDG